MSDRFIHNEEKPEVQPVSWLSALGDGFHTAFKTTVAESVDKMRNSVGVGNAALLFAKNDHEMEEAYRNV